MKRKKSRILIPLILPDQNIYLILKSKGKTTSSENIQRLKKSKDLQKLTQSFSDENRVLNYL